MVNFIRNLDSNYIFICAGVGRRDAKESRGLGEVYKRQDQPDELHPSWYIVLQVKGCQIIVYLILRAERIDGLHIAREDECQGHQQPAGIHHNAKHFAGLYTSPKRRLPKSADFVFTVLHSPSFPNRIAPNTA